MFRQTIITLLGLVLAATCLAVPAKMGQWRTVTLKDGTVVKVELRGDEHCSYWGTDDGRCFMEEGDNGAFVEIYRSELETIALSHRKTASIGHKRNAIGEAPIELKGTKKCLCILVDFTDKKFQPTNDLELFRNMINKVNYVNVKLQHMGSVRDYFLEQSEGQFDIDFDVVGPFTLSKNAAYYGEDSSNGQTHDLHALDMAREAVALADEFVDYKDYDWNGDRFCEAVFILYAGMGQADGGGKSTIWPHKASIRTMADGVVITDYACGSELSATGRVSGIGTMCHEYSHCLGLPDMYDIDYQCNTYGPHAWDLMSQGYYLNDSNSPCSYTAYEKWFAGWKTPKVLTTTQEVTNMKPLADGGDAYVIYNDGYKNEFFMLENRSRVNCDRDVLGEGLLIYHVDYDSKAWAHNLVNCCKTDPSVTSHPRLDVMAADNSYSKTDGYDAGDDVFPYKNGSFVNNSFSNTTTPAAKLYHQNTDGSYFLNKAVINIRHNSDKSVDFTFINEMEKPNVPEGALFYESFSKTYGNGGNDDSFEATTAAGITPDLQNWSLLNCLAGMQCIQVGTQMMVGKATTPEFEVDGSVIMTFRAASVDLDNATLKLSVASGDAELSAASQAVKKGEWGTYSVKISGSGKVKIMFSTPRGLTSINRIYLDDVTVMPDPDGIYEAHNATEAHTDNRIFNLTGQRLTTAPQNGIYIRNGRKVINLNK